MIRDRREIGGAPAGLSVTGVITGRCVHSVCVRLSIEIAETVCKIDSVAPVSDGWSTFAIHVVREIAGRSIWGS